VCVCVCVWDINLLWRLPLTPLHRERSYVDFPPSLPEVSRVAFVAKPTPRKRVTVFKGLLTWARFHPLCTGYLHPTCR